MSYYDKMNKHHTHPINLSNPYMQVNGYVCQCLPGYTGRHCDVKTNACIGSPCVNSESCENTPDGFNCICKDGYSGTFCENNINVSILCCVLFLTLNILRCRMVQFKFLPKIFKRVFWRRWEFKLTLMKNKYTRSMHNEGQILIMKAEQSSVIFPAIVH